MPSLLDTHAWVWWVTEDPRLPNTTQRTIERAATTDGLWLSLISVWEVAKKVEKGQLVLDRPVDDWLDAATTRPGLQLAELSPLVLLESCRLPQPFHGDPADQIIVATARDRDTVVVTKDRKIIDYVHVRSTWS